MIEYLAYRTPQSVFLLVVSLTTIVAIIAGYQIGRRTKHRTEDDVAISVAEASVFGLAALILAFSFSLAATRYSSRADLIQRESNVIGTAYELAGFLPAAQAAQFRIHLRSYTETRIAEYGNLNDTQALAADDSALRRDLYAMWIIAATQAHRDARNLQYEQLLQTIDEIQSVAETQAVTLRSHIPTAIIELVVVVALASAGVWGYMFGMLNRPYVLLSLLYALLLSAVLYTIIDFDRPVGGTIQVDLSPLRAQLENMKP